MLRAHYERSSVPATEQRVSTEREVNVTVTQTAHTIRLKDGAVRDAMAASGIELVSTLHRRMGISRSQLDHVVKGGRQPGARFVGSLLAALPAATFDDLFDVVPVDQPGEQT